MWDVITSSSFNRCLIKLLKISAYGWVIILSSLFIMHIWYAISRSGGQWFVAHVNLFYDYIDSY